MKKESECLKIKKIALVINLVFLFVVFSIYASFKIVLNLIKKDLSCNDNVVYKKEQIDLNQQLIKIVNARNTNIGIFEIEYYGKILSSFILIDENHSKNYKRGTISFEFAFNYDEIKNKVFDYCDFETKDNKEPVKYEKTGVCKNNNYEIALLYNNEGIMIKDEFGIVLISNNSKTTKFIYMTDLPRSTLKDTNYNEQIQYFLNMENKYKKIKKYKLKS